MPNHRGRKTASGQASWAGEIASRPRQHLHRGIHSILVRKELVGRGKGEVERKEKSSCVRLKKIDLITNRLRFRFCLLHPRFKRPITTITMADVQLPFTACLKFLAQRVPQHLRQPKVGIICGSGLSTLTASLTDITSVPYAEIPGFGISTGTIPSKIAKCENSVLGCSSRP